MMRVLLHGEGVTDYGKGDGMGGWIEGPIQIIIKRIVGEVEIDCVTKDDIKTHRNRLQRKLSGLKGHGTYAALLIHIANERNVSDTEWEYDVVALYRDADRQSGKDARKLNVCQRRYEEIKQEIFQGFGKFPCEVRFIAIIPMKMIENWLLADPKCFVSAFGGKQLNLPDNPELLWGDLRDRDSDHPKNVLSRILAIYQKESNVDTYKELAVELNFEIARQKCFISFEDFYQQLRTVKHISDSASKRTCN